MLPVVYVVTAADGGAGDTGGERGVQAPLDDVARRSGAADQVMVARSLCTGADRNPGQDRGCRREPRPATVTVLLHAEVPATLSAATR